MKGSQFGIKLTYAVQPSPNGLIRRLSLEKIH